MAHYVFHTLMIVYKEGQRREVWGKGVQMHAEWARLKQSGMMDIEVCRRKGHLGKPTASVGPGKWAEMAGLDQHETIPNQPSVCRNLKPEGDLQNSAKTASLVRCRHLHRDHHLVSACNKLASSGQPSSKRTLQWYLYSILEFQRDHIVFLWFHISTVYSFDYETFWVIQNCVFKKSTSKTNQLQAPAFRLKQYRSIVVLEWRSWKMFADAVL